MKKALIISNITTKFTNFIIPSIEVLNKLGYEVHTCANYSNFNDDENKYNITMHHIDLERSPYNLKNINAYRQLLKIMKKENFDLVHCNTPIGGLLGRICAKKTKIPVVIYTAHGFHFYKGAPFINNVIYKLVEKWLAHYTDILITMNKEDYEAAKKFKLKENGKLMTVHGVGIDLYTTKEKLSEMEKQEIRKKMKLEKDDIVCITVGELNKNKNHKTIIEAINLVKNKKIHLLICGVGNEQINLEKMVIKYNLENQIHFLGYRNDIPLLLKISDIYMQMSYREGLPRAVLEALDAELPCIVSNIRGNVDLVQDEKGGFLCDVNDVEKISDSLLKLSKDKSLREKMGQVNKNNVEKYDVKNVIKELENIYMLK